MSGCENCGVTGPGYRAVGLLFCDEECARQFVGSPDPRKAVHDGETAARLRLVAQIAKLGKARIDLVDLPFVESMARVLEAGLRKAGRVPDGWKALDPATRLHEYRAALLRHAVATDSPHAVEPESGESHYAAVAVNAMICAYLEAGLRRQRAPKRVDDVLDDLAALWGSSPAMARETVLRLADKLAAQRDPGPNLDQLSLGLDGPGPRVASHLRKHGITPDAERAASPSGPPGDADA